VNQHLVAPALAGAVDVVRRLGAVQAQDYGAAKWAIAQRTQGRLRDAQVEDAFATGAILRTHVLRPTWHFILPGDARWMLELTAPRIGAAMAHYNRQLELDATVFRKSHAALVRALRDGQHRTRAELQAALARAGVNVSSGQRAGNLLMQAELDGVIISGPRRGKQFTYALFDERVPAAPSRDREEALDDLTRRYFATRGPATVQDLAWWSGLTVADAQRGVEIAGASLVREQIDDRAYWSTRDGTGTVRRWTRIAHLLSNYDEYFIGFHDRSAFGERLRAARPAAHVDVLMGHLLSLDGQIVGGWRRTLGATVHVDLQLLVRLPTPERALARRAGRRFGVFLGLPVRVREHRRSR
jgi:winged helix DNA-binding protein